MVGDQTIQSKSQIIELQKTDLEKDMAALFIEYGVCGEKARTTTDPVTQAKLEAQKTRLMEQIKEKEQLIKELERQGEDANRQTLDFDEALPRIDFRKAREIIIQVVETLQIDEGGAALMLMQQNRAMAGDLLLRALDDVLRSGGQPPDWYPVKFLPTSGEANEHTFLKILGGHLGIEPSGDLEADVATVAQTLCGSLRGSTVVIHLTNWDVVGSANQKLFMEWLLESFWRSLVDQLSSVLDEWYARVIFVIVANRELTADCRESACFCTVDEFDSCSILELPLESWTEQDIRLWLQDHFQLPKSQRNQWAELIYTESNGAPALARTALQEYFDQLLASQKD